MNGIITNVIYQGNNFVCKKCKGKIVCWDIRDEIPLDLPFILTPPRRIGIDKLPDEIKRKITEVEL